MLLEQLSRHNDLSLLTEEQLDLLQDIDFDSLQNLDPVQISQILDETGLFLVPHEKTGLDRTSKRMYAFNYHDNSDDYKNLGTLHRDNRTVEYFPQDEAQDFSTRPQIMGRELSAIRDHFENTGTSIEPKMSEIDPLDDREVEGFPKTTNQDFHNEDVYRRFMQIQRPEKSNNKKSNSYMSYVNAMFN